MYEPRLRGRQARDLGGGERIGVSRRRAPGRRARRDDELRADRRLRRPRPRAVLQRLEGLLERSGDPRSRRSRGWSRSSPATSRVCAAAQRLEAQGVASKDAAATLRQHPFYVSKLYQQARNYAPEELVRRRCGSPRLDHALKGGSHLSPELELERALIEITRRRALRARAAPARLAAAAAVDACSRSASRSRGSRGLRARRGAGRRARSARAGRSPGSAKGIRSISDERRRGSRACASSDEILVVGEGEAGRDGRRPDRVGVWPCGGEQVSGREVVEERDRAAAAHPVEVALEGREEHLLGRGW